MSKRDKSDKTEADARQAILARRQFFIASAVAGVALAGCDDKPSVCLNVVSPDPTQDPIEDPSPTPTPTPTASASTASSAEPAPTVCLEMTMPDPTTAPAPEVCLKIKPPPPPPPGPTAQPRVCLNKQIVDDD